MATSGARTLRHVSAETVEAFAALDRCARESELAELAGRIGQPLAVVELLVAQEIAAGRIVRTQDGAIRLDAARVPRDLRDALRALSLPENGAGGTGGVHVVDRLG